MREGEEREEGGGGEGSEGGGRGGEGREGGETDIVLGSLPPQTPVFWLEEDP